MFLRRRFYLLLLAIALITGIGYAYAPLYTVGRWLTLLLLIATLVLLARTNAHSINRKLGRSEKIPSASMQLTALVLAPLVTLFAFAFGPKTEGAWQSHGLVNLVQDVRDMFSFYGEGIYGEGSFDLGYSGLAPHGMTLGGDIDPNNRTVMRVKTSTPILLAGAVYDSVISKIDYVSYTGNNVAYYTTTVDVDTGDTENIYPGMQATVTVPLEEANNVTVLKMEALSTARDNTAFVYKQAADGTMERVPVTVGVSNGNYVEIREGVADGETIYAVAPQEEQLTGLAGLFSSMFSRQQVNRPGNMPGGNQQRNWNRDSQNGTFPGGGGNNGAPSGGGRGN